MILSDDEAQATGLMNAAIKRFGKDAVEKVIAEMPARDANDAQRVLDLAEQTRHGQ